jgi:hypothetical protein
MASQLGRRLVLAFALLFFLIALHLILKDLERLREGLCRVRQTLRAKEKDDDQEKNQNMAGFLKKH